MYINCKPSISSSSDLHSERVLHDERCKRRRMYLYLILSMIKLL